MDSVYRGLAVYCILFIIFRIAGKRTLTEISTFDFLLLLIISEATQQAMIDSDHSITGAVIVICTLVGFDIFLSVLKQKYPALGKALDGIPIVVLRDGKLLRERADKERVTEDDVLAAARRLHGLERMDQIRYAIIEESGGLSIIPKAPEREKSSV
jgi:uncharacterized membrane protein YcaP (DUF421 family)